MNKLLHIQSNKLKPKKGRVLISEPFMGDYYFGRSVVLLVEHSDEEGTFGVVMNKPTGSVLSDMAGDSLLAEYDFPVYVGGPVQTDSLFYMHTLQNLSDPGEEVLPGLFWGGDIGEIEELLKLNLATPEQIRFFLGYSGWQANQLSGELKRNSWLVSESNINSLLRISSHKMWNHFMMRMGPTYDLWRKYPVDPMVN